MLPDEFTDSDRAAVVKAITESDHDEVYKNMLTETSMALMNMIEDTNIDPSELSDAEVEQILEDVAMMRSY